MKMREDLIFHLILKFSFQNICMLPEINSLTFILHKTTKTLTVVFNVMRKIQVCSSLLPSTPQPGLCKYPRHGSEDLVFQSGSFCCNQQFGN